MTVLYLSARYLGMPFAVYVWKAQHCCCTDEPYLTISLNILISVPTILLTDAVSLLH
ncbi:hypothetical protein BDR03DRAFT_974922 [Suillus americanus]|nr:hypothetical protein BDR03DRAFT_974922 [Suillus americanus]